MRAAVAGRPIGHSLSPALHLAAYAALALDWTYTSRDCGTAQLPALVSEIRAAAGEWAGLSLTMPLKAAAGPLLDEVETPLGAVNTVVVGRDGTLRGYNTDVDGILSGLDALLGARVPDEVAILGSGGTARAALAALALRGTGGALLLARDGARARPAADLGRPYSKVPTPMIAACSARLSPRAVSTVSAGPATRRSLDSAVIPGSSAPR